MTIEEKVQAILGAAAAVTAIVPAARIKVPGSWQNLATPYVIHFPVSARPGRTHNGLNALRQWDFYQVSCFGSTYSSARALAAVVVAALDGVHDDVHLFWKNQRTVSQPELEIEQVILDFEIAEAL